MEETADTQAGKVGMAANGNVAVIKPVDQKSRAGLEHEVLRLNDGVSQICIHDGVLILHDQVAYQISPVESEKFAQGVYNQSYAQMRAECGSEIHFEPHIGMYHGSDWLLEFDDCQKITLRQLLEQFYSNGVTDTDVVEEPIKNCKCKKAPSRNKDCGRKSQGARRW